MRRRHKSAASKIDDGKKLSIKVNQAVLNLRQEYIDELEKEREEILQKQKEAYKKKYIMLAQQYDNDISDLNSEIKSVENGKRDRTLIDDKIQAIRSTERERELGKQFANDSDITIQRSINYLESLIDKNRPDSYKQLYGQNAIDYKDLTEERYIRAKIYKEKQKYGLE